MKVIKVSCNLYFSKNKTDEEIEEILSNSSYIFKDEEDEIESDNLDWDIDTIKKISY